MNDIKYMSLDQFRLGNNYQTEEFIGSGSTGAVFKAIDLKNSKTVAVKIIKAEYSKHEKFISCLKSELKDLITLQHNNIVKLEQLGFDNDKHYIVSEYVAGKSLDKILEEKPVLDIDYSINILKQIATGLNYAGENSVVHKSLKPEDIIISENNVVKITGFGLSKAIATAWLTMTGTSPAQVEYMSPEQAEGEIIDQKSDIYSVGIIAYKILTGEVPFKKEGSSILSIAMKHINTIPDRPSLKNPDIPVWLDNIILKCLEKNPSLRFQNGNELLHALENQGEINREIIKQLIESKSIYEEDVIFSIDNDELNKVISEGFTDFSENIKTSLLKNEDDNRVDEVLKKIKKSDIDKILDKNKESEDAEKIIEVKSDNKISKKQIKILLICGILLEVMIISLLTYIFINL